MFPNRLRDLLLLLLLFANVEARSNLPAAEDFGYSAPPVGNKTSQAGAKHRDLIPKLTKQPEPVFGNPCK